MFNTSTPIPMVFWMPGDAGGGGRRVDAPIEKALREHLLATEITKTRRQQRRMHDRLQALGYIE